MPHRHREERPALTQKHEDVLQQLGASTYPALQRAVDAVHALKSGLAKVQEMGQLVRGLSQLDATAQTPLPGQEVTTAFSLDVTLLRPIRVWLLAYASAEQKLDVLKRHSGAYLRARDAKDVNPDGEYVIIERWEEGERNLFLHCEWLRDSAVCLQQHIAHTLTECDTAIHSVLAAVGTSSLLPFPTELVGVPHTQPHIQAYAAEPAPPTHHTDDPVTPHTPSPLALLSGYPFNALADAPAGSKAEDGAAALPAAAAGDAGAGSSASHNSHTHAPWHSATHSALAALLAPPTQAHAGPHGVGNVGLHGVHVAGHGMATREAAQTLILGDRLPNLDPDPDVVFAGASDPRWEIALASSRDPPAAAAAPAAGTAESHLSRSITIPAAQVETAHIDGPPRAAGGTTGGDGSGDDREEAIVGGPSSYVPPSPVAQMAAMDQLMARANKAQKDTHTNTHETTTAAIAGTNTPTGDDTTSPVGNMDSIGADSTSKHGDMGLSKHKTGATAVHLVLPPNVQPQQQPAGMLSPAVRLDQGGSIMGSSLPLSPIADSVKRVGGLTGGAPPLVLRLNSNPTAPLSPSASAALDNLAASLQPQSQSQSQPQPQLQLQSQPQPQSQVRSGSGSGCGAPVMASEPTLFASQLSAMLQPHVGASAAGAPEAHGTARMGVDVGVGEGEGVGVGGGGGLPALGLLFTGMLNTVTASPASTAPTTPTSADAAPAASAAGASGASATPATSGGTTPRSDTGPKYAAEAPPPVLTLMPNPKRAPTTPQRGAAIMGTSPVQFWPKDNTHHASRDTPSLMPPVERTHSMGGQIHATHTAAPQAFNGVPASWHPPSTVGPLAAADTAVGAEPAAGAGRTSPGATAPPLTPRRARGMLSQMLGGGDT